MSQKVLFSSVANCGCFHTLLKNLNSFVVLTDIFWLFGFGWFGNFCLLGFFSPFLFDLVSFVWVFACLVWGILCSFFFLNFVLNLKVKGNVLVLYFGDLHFYKVEYLFLKYSTIFDNSYLEHNGVFERNNYEMPKYLAKSSNKN